MGENHFAPLPTALYGAVLLCSAIAYTILQTAVIGAQGPHSNLATAVGSDLKGKLSIAAYVAAIPLAFVNQWISDALYVAVAPLWLRSGPGGGGRGGPAGGLGPAKRRGPRGGP